MDIAALALSPFVLGIYVALIGSVGVAILLLSSTFSVALWPVSRYCELVEKKINEKLSEISAEISLIDPRLKGEERFNMIELVFDRHDYHPIQNVLIGLRFFISIPVLISAIIVMNGSPELVGEAFGFIVDLSKPDELVVINGWPINAMPIILLILSVIDARIRYAGNSVAQYRFYLISVLLVALVYSLPAALILYWTGANLTAFLIFCLSQYRKMG